MLQDFMNENSQFILLTFLFIWTILVYVIGVQFFYLKTVKVRKIYISSALSIGMWGFLIFPEFILNFSEYTGGEMAVLFVIIGFFVCVGYFIIVLPMSLLSEKIARAPLRLIKAMLVHVLPAVICPLIWVYFVINRDVNWEVALFGVFAFPYWILDELLRKRNSC